MLDWLIIGGGIHGVHIAARLLGEARVEPGRLRIIDPGDHLLERWRSSTAATGMTYLRSPAVHHLDLDPFSLQVYAARRRRRDRSLFTMPYDRPSLGLFNEHCDQVVERYALEELHIRDRAERCTVDCDKVDVRLASGRELATQNLVLAIGVGEQPAWPDWAPRHDERIRHIFDVADDTPPAAEGESIVVVGGGITAAQIALRLVGDGHTVDVVARHAPREHQFDSDPGWLGPKYTADFGRERNPERRRAVITQARHRGSMPPDVARAIARAIRRDQVRWHQGEVERVTEGSDALDITLCTGAILVADRVVLATGFESRRPGGGMVDQLIESASLPCARCGYPIVDADLRWHPRIFVSGPLAELELGPVSRNIAGARRAGDRLVNAVLAGAS